MAEYVCDIDERPYKYGTAWSVAEKREPIVRCRDCEYANRYGYQLECVGPIQGAYSECAEVDPEDFCSKGERRHA